jgi:hypothetical protein
LCAKSKLYLRVALTSRAAAMRLAAILDTGRDGAPVHAVTWACRGMAIAA